MNKSKKNAPGAATPEAKTKNPIKISLPQNGDFVKSKAWIEIETLFLELPSETKLWFVDWAQLYFKDTAFREAFDDLFGEDWERLNFQEAREFVDAWKAVKV